MRNVKSKARHYHTTEANLLLLEAIGTCSICGCDLDDTEPLQIDHSHTAPEAGPRGPLCRRHNLGIGLFDDDPTLLGLFKGSGLG
jgi:hypothetical protein